MRKFVEVITKIYLKRNLISEEMKKRDLSSEQKHKTPPITIVKRKKKKEWIEKIPKQSTRGF